MSHALFRPFDSSLEITARAYAQSLTREASGAESGPEFPENDSSGCSLKTVFTESTGIVGGGLMGTAIAATHLKAACPVRIFDLDENVSARLSGKISAELVLRGGNDFDGNDFTLDVEKNVRDTVLRRLEIARSLHELRSCDVMIETIPERRNFKKRLYAQLDGIGFTGYLFTNTSTMEITRLAASLARPERFCGFHFFHPVRKRALVEIVGGKATSSQTLHVATRHARRIGKIPLVVSDGPGFLVNRLLNPVLREALTLLAEGVPLLHIEGAVERFGMPMGPFRMIDEIGLDVVLHAGWTMGKAFPQRAVESPLLLNMIELGRLGRKSGAGFFRYMPDVSGESVGVGDPVVEKLLPQRRVECSEERIVERLFPPMLCEAVRAVEEGVVRQFRQADLAALLGLGFPAARGGICFWADAVGLREIVRLLRTLREKFGERFTPPRTLVDFAERGQILSRFRADEFR